MAQPEQFDVIVTDNLFGDVLTALGAAIAGGLELAASASISPERTGPSAPDIAGKQMADPTAAILSAAMLCEHLGMTEAASRIEQAVAEDLLVRQGEWVTRNTAEIGERVSG